MQHELHLSTLRFFKQKTIPIINKTTMDSKTYRKTKYQIIPIVIAAANATGSADVPVDQNYSKIVGIQAACTDTKPFQKGYFTKFEIGAKEIYPEGFEAKMIAGGQDCPVSERFDKQIDETGNGASVKIVYKDANVAATTFPYTVNVYLWLTNPNK